MADRASLLARTTGIVAEHQRKHDVLVDRVPALISDTLPSNLPAGVAAPDEAPDNP